MFTYFFIFSLLELPKNVYLINKYTFDSIGGTRMRGRKKETSKAYNETISIKINEDQKDAWKKNKWIAAEVREIVRKHLNLYVMKK